ncbi:MAG: ParA family protein [Deltaproteobacteria bacterium]|nr:ParA family protein [Deltaproteobacteria bacterium]
MTEIIGFCNQKGGVGKTTSAVNVAASIAFLGKKVLLVDIDPQCNATSALGLEKNSLISNSYNLFTHENIPSPVATDLANLDIVPSTTELVGAEIELVSFDERETRIKSSLRHYLGRYDFIFVDAPPSLGLLTLNLLTASTSLLIPVQCEYFALEGLTELLKTIDLVKKRLNPTLSIGGIILTMFDGRNRLSHDVERELRTHFSEQVFKTVIPRSVRISEAPSHGMPIIVYDHKSRGAQSYLDLSQEILERYSLQAPGGDTWKEERLVEVLPR